MIDPSNSKPHSILTLISVGKARQNAVICRTRNRKTKIQPMKNLLSLLFVALLTAGSSFSQTAEEIIENYLENIGGIDAWKKVESLKMKGKMSMQGMDIPFEMYSKAPNKEYMEMSIMGKNIVEAFDGEKVWRINPFMGNETAHKGTEAENLEKQKDEFESKFINYEEKGHAIELLGEEEIEGTNCFIIKMTEKDGSESKMYMDTEAYVPIMISTVIVEEGDMKGKESKTYFSDYQEIDGVYMAFHTETKIDGQTVMKMIVDEVELNADVDDSKFEMPEE